MKQVLLHHLGTKAYSEVFQIQKQYFDQMLLNESQGNSQPADSFGHFILCEHPHVYTLGKNGQQNNLLINSDFLKQINAEYHQTDRGGDITYHGPGQLVGYPILRLSLFDMRIRTYIETLEDVIICLLKDYGINSTRLDSATGVWIDAGKENARKICAIGVKTSKLVTMHGFALNINTQLEYFNHINPCGFTDKGVTSMQKELGFELSVEEIKEKLIAKFETFFKVKTKPAIQ